MTNLILPCIVLGALTVFSFKLPPESGERISLVITILLGLTVFMLVFTENVPRTSEVIPLIVKYAFTVMCEVSFSLLITCFVVRVYHRNPSKSMPAWYRYLTYRILAPALMMKKPSGAKQDKQTCEKHQLERAKSNHRRGSNIYVSKLFGSYERGSNCCKVELESKEGDDLVEVVSENSRHSESLKCPSLDKLDEISRGMRVVIDHIKDVKTTESNKNEWHFAAQVLDCFFFWILLVAFAVSTSLFYLSIP